MMTNTAMMIRAFKPTTASRHSGAQLRRHAETKASCALWKDGRGTTCHLLLDPDHLRNPIRLFPRVSLAQLCVERAQKLNCQQAEQHQRPGGEQSRLLPCRGDRCAPISEAPVR